MFIFSISFSVQSLIEAKHKMSAMADSLESKLPSILSFTNQGISCAPFTSRVLKGSHKLESRLSKGVRVHPLHPLLYLDG